VAAWDGRERAVLEQYGHNLPDEVDVAVARRWQALHIRGVDYFVTEDIASFFGVPPNAVEWLNLTSCTACHTCKTSG